LNYFIYGPLKTDPSCLQNYEISEKYNIEKIKTIGDAYMAAGGIPHPDENSLKNIVLAGLEMQAFVIQRAIENQQYQKPFLKELALLISSNAAANGAQEIHWSISYPSAFSSNEVARYRRVWVELYEELNRVTGIKHQLTKRGGEGGLQTEAVAFASYFGNFQNRQMVHTSCLDIGGGTTDISVWQENRLIHQASVPFAGMDMSSQLLLG
jgi:hypothetical protein